MFLNIEMNASHLEISESYSPVEGDTSWGEKELGQFLGGKGRKGEKCSLTAQRLSVGPKGMRMISIYPHEGAPRCENQNVGLPSYPPDQVRQCSSVDVRKAQQ